MNIVPVITLFGGLAAFFTLAVALRFIVGKSQASEKQTDKPLVG